MFPDVKRDPSANLPGEGAAPEGPISSNVGSNRISAGRQTLPSITVPQLSTMRPGAASNGTVEGTQGGGMAPRVNSVNYTKGMDLTKLPPGTVLNFREGPRMWNGRQVTDLGSTSGARANP